MITVAFRDCLAKGLRVVIGEDAYEFTKQRGTDESLQCFAECLTLSVVSLDLGVK